MMRMLSALILTGLLGVTGCQGDEDSMEPMDAGQTMVVTTPSGPASCAEMCMQMYRTCVRMENDVATCAADRDACKKECS
jgi:hypothetical protein